MGSIVLLSIIIAVAIALLVVPFTKKGVKEQKALVNHTAILITTAIFVFIISVVFFYLTKVDLNWTILWPLLIIATLLGSIAASGKEQILKGSLFFISLVIGIYMLSAPLWNANEKYRGAKMNQKVEIEPFDEHETPASVPPKFARNKMKKAFGQVPNTSYYQLGNLQIQKVNGKYVYIAPVEFSGFFKWLKGKVTPGYFIMSATNAADNPKFIKQEMTYTPSSYFQKNLERHIRLANPTKIFYGDPQLEVNDDGKPYYIRTYGTFVSARNGFKASGIVMVDPKTGASKTYSLKHVPDFIDGAVSPEAVSLQNSYFGKYIHGFWNSVFGKRDVKLPTDEGTEANVSPIFDDHGNMYYFTDFTSPKAGVDSMLGYSLTNGKTGKATYYTGNLQESYMDSQGNLQIVEKKFIEKKWKGSMPILYNFYGEASWFTPVLDSNGFLQTYFIVSAANPEISVNAETPNAALKLYKLALQRGDSSLNRSSTSSIKTVSGTVLRVYKEKDDEYTSVSFLLSNHKNFIVSSEVSPLAVYLKEGDKVIVKYLNTGEQFLPVKDMTIKDLNVK
ncbi:sulfite exporter TauE/SafE family protein [Heyndrickxia ginsengihumi]|uniref:Membrane protein n=1 Tax=Heyndrickxia ginsengihumi TaxID=363870 RepID=A0A0A6Y2W4_9BACI|nr:sulfite exporter TauE/SafE family protein [Heyndrickxia ginsengihumi]KHD86622.1 membrane protein [Heyndrickxia ginsengihumi]MBE6185000.1 sulfite exporter TauE/SafE family protein [Bacillus sp. (in: firmicutes)]MCM3022660.1 sulfite exporter TauE/SafE family protein [Heyndrickxia ginsengihumi]NEY19001.1 sulfite exporter TauE/SafE family protein [Heyndrickxia ginsengihumi]